MNVIEAIDRELARLHGVSDCHWSWAQGHIAALLARLCELEYTEARLAVEEDII